MLRKLILRSRLSPGDVVTMTAAVESLHATYPGEYLTDVRTTVGEIWEFNPRITPISDDGGESVDLDYPSIHASNGVPLAFLNGYVADLGVKLGIRLALTTNRPHLYLSDEERGWVNQVRHHFTHGRDVRFWLVTAGVKADFTAKQWPVEFYQEVVDATRGRIQWVQVGASEHDHVPLRGAINLVGQTDHRQLIRLAFHAQGGLGPVTYLQHLLAAWEKPYLCLLGGREPVNWVQYPRQFTFHSIGLLPCCREGACWRSRVVPLGDGEPHDRSLCDQPVIGLTRPVAKCMAMIRPAELLAVLDRLLVAN